MKPISIGKLRGLQQISSHRGTFTALALDHRQNLRKANPAFVEDAELSRFKVEVTSALAKRATAVLLDPEVSAAQAIAQRAIPNRVGLVVAVESTTIPIRPRQTRSKTSLPGSRRSAESMILSSCLSRYPIHWVKIETSLLRRSAMWSSKLRGDLHPWMWISSKLSFRSI
jgi:hypothetical protein